MPRLLTLLLALVLAFTLASPSHPVTAQPIPLGTPHIREDVGQLAKPMIPSWIRQFGTLMDDQAYGVTVDNQGNSYVTGFTAGAFPGQINSGGSDVFVHKYNPRGSEVWTHQFGTAEQDYALSVAVDSQGNSYVAGYTFGTLPGQTNNGWQDVFLRKYNSNGAEVWTREFGSRATDFASGVTVDSQGNSYITGSTEGSLPGQTSSGGDDAFIRSYDPTGTERWTHQFGSNMNDEVTGLAVDTNGNNYVVGYTTGTFSGQTSSGGPDAFLRVYDSSGAEVWTHQFGTTMDDRAYGVAVDTAGNSYVTGWTDGAFPNQTGSGDADVFLRKYDPSGTDVWTNQFGSSLSDYAYGVAVDTGGNSYVAGITFGLLPGQTSSGGPDAFLRTYDSTGIGIWTRQFGSSMSDDAFDVAVDNQGNGYVAGWTAGTLPGQTNSGGQDPFLVRFVAVAASVALPLTVRQASAGW